MFTGIISDIGTILAVEERGDLHVRIACGYDTGSIDIGSNAFVGEASVLDIGTAMGNDTQLGHASSLQTGQRVPDGKR